MGSYLASPSCGLGCTGAVRSFRSLYLSQHPRRSHPKSRLFMAPFEPFDPLYSQQAAEQENHTTQGKRHEERFFGK